jgi:hypothetical protein
MFSNIPYLSFLYILCCLFAIVSVKNSYSRKICVFVKSLFIDLNGKHTELYGLMLVGMRVLELINLHMFNFIQNPRQTFGQIFQINNVSEGVLLILQNNEFVQPVCSKPLDVDLNKQSDQMPIEKDEDDNVINNEQQNESDYSLDE